MIQSILIAKIVFAFFTILFTTVNALKAARGQHITSANLFVMSASIVALLVLYKVIA